jgi:predicted rRNA methylase
LRSKFNSPPKTPDRPRKRDGFRAKSSIPDGLFNVEGIAAVREYLRFRPESVVSIFAKERPFESIRAELSEFKPRITVVPENAAEESSVLPATPVWAQVAHKVSSMDILENELKKDMKAAKSILVLDHISDPRNLGAIVRSAAFFGISHVIVPEKRQVLLTQSAVNTAQGGFALCDLVVVVNISRVLEQLKAVNFWVLGAAIDGEPLERYQGKFERQAIVLGSEDKGISPSVLSRCDVKISIKGARLALESLNVSVAAGIVLHRLVPVP